MGARPADRSTVRGGVGALADDRYLLPGDAVRARRPSDVLLVLSATFGVVVLGLAATPTAGFERAVDSFLAALPAFLTGVWQLLAGLLVVLALGLFAAAALSRRWDLVRDLAVALGIALVVSLVVARAVQGDWPRVWESFIALAPPARFPSLRVALAGSVVLAAVPHLGRPARRVGSWVLGLGAFSTAALGATTAGGALAGLLCAATGAAAAHAWFGSPSGRPSLGQVQESLVGLGIDVDHLDPLERQPEGVFQVEVVTADGSRLIAKVYGRDAHDLQLFGSLWRAVKYRGAAAPVAVGRLRQVQYEALLTLLARQGGVRTPEIVRAGATAAGDALLVLEPFGTPIAELPQPAEATARCERIWEAVLRLHTAGIVHGQLDDEHLVVEADRVGIIDFRDAALIEEHSSRNVDVAQTLVCTTLLTGPEVALGVARQVLDAEGLTAAIPLLQPAALTPRQRAAVKAGTVDLEALRTGAAALLDIEPPALARLQRLTWVSVAQAVLLPIAMFALVSGLTQLDLGQVRDQLARANWWFVALAALTVQLSWAAHTVSAMGASPIPLPPAPVFVLQHAISYLGLVVPSSAGRIAVNVRFLQRQGLRPGAALASGALDGFAGFVVQVALLLSVALLSPDSVDFDLNLGDVSVPTRLILAIAALLLLSAAVVYAVPRWRHATVTWVRTMATEALSALRGLRSPRRLAMLLGGNLASDVVLALTLGCVLAAFGHSVGLAQLLLIIVGVSLLAGIMPVPGGIGVTESALILALVGAGLPEETAFPAVIIYRLLTFYLPPIGGFFALRWLERNDYV